MKIKLINALLLASGVTVAGPNVSTTICVDMDPAQTGIQSTITLRDTGTSFSVAIVAQNVTDLIGSEITLKIDTTKYKFISKANGSAFNNSMPDIWASDSSWVKFTYARMEMTPQYLTASEAQLGTVTLKNKMGFGGSAQIQVLSGKFAAVGPEYDDFTAIAAGIYNVLQPQCPVSILTAPGGTINTTSISVNYNTPSIPITATPDGCHTFKLWELVSGSVIINSPTMATTTVTPTGNCQIRATYTAIQYTLTVSSDGNGNILGGGGTYDCGIQPTVQSTPNTGYAFSNWTVVSGNASFSNANAASTTVMISGNAAVQANFTRIVCAVSIDDNGDGTVESTRSVQYGASESITAATIPTQTFVNWTVTGNGTLEDASSATTTVTLTGAAALTAHFTATKYLLNLTATNGTVSPSGPQSVNHGDSTQVTAQPNADYAFVDWTITEGASNVTLRTPNEPTTWVVVTGPATIQANFSAAVLTHACVPKTPLAFDLTVSDASIQYTVPSGKQGRIIVKVMGMNGKLITERVASADVAGYFKLDLKNIQKGCYVCSMKAGNFGKMVKVMLVK